MSFSTPFFLFGFLPVVILAYYLAPTAKRNSVLLFMSLFFYAWGEVFYLAIMLVSIASNYYFGRAIGDSIDETGPGKSSRLYLAGGIAVNLALLISFKYANFITDNINLLLQATGIPPFELAPVHLPLGISFFTFQALSYIIDVYRREVPAQRSLGNLALYISLFPQLIAGPIVRYHDISQQITGRHHSLELASSGARRFIFGLSKKMLIANPLGEVADKVFALSDNDLTMPLAWIGLLAYTFQIYFDFSGYSDMAIGLGRIFGFRLLENFNYPYIARSLREFWRRWHISLSTWFKDYVYISLGGSRVPTRRVYFNLLLVFVLTGIWHGASWNFLVWGLFHGFFLTIEHAGFSRTLNRLPRPVQHFYMLFAVVIGWVFFRAETISQAFFYLRTMFSVSNFETTQFLYTRTLSNEAFFAFAVGLVLSLPVYGRAREFLNNAMKRSSARVEALMYIPRLGTLTLIFFISLVKVASSTYNPFIYFRF